MHERRVIYDHKSRKMITNPAFSIRDELLFRRAHIPLYPSLSRSINRIGLAWYEYGASDGPAPSRVFFASRTETGSFSSPEPVTGPEDYDNGPFLLETDAGAVLAWHSWRSPGRGPYTRDARRYVWMSQERNGQWSLPNLLLGETYESSYPALAGTKDELWMTVTLGLSEIVLTRMDASGLWSPIPAAATGQHSDLYFDQSAMVMAFDSDKSIYVGRLSPEGFSQAPVRIEGAQGSRPRISRVGNYYWLVWHSDHWGPKTWTATIEHRGGQLLVEMEPGSDAANRHWAVSRLDLFDSQTRNYGGVLGSPSFRGRWNIIPDMHCRVMGEDVFHAAEKRSLALDLPPGRYRVSLQAESWVGSRISLQATVNGFPLTPPIQQADRLFVSRSADLIAWAPPVALTGGEEDCNRPTRIIPLDRELFLIYNHFGRDSVDLRALTFTLPE